MNPSAKRLNPSVKVVPKSVLEGQPVLLCGSEWPDCPAHVTLRGQPARIDLVLQGHQVPSGVRPTNGRFTVRVTTYGLKPGRYKLTVAGPRLVEKLAFGVRKRPPIGRGERDANVAYWRGLAQFERRFAKIGYVPAGVVATRIQSIDQLRTQLRPIEARVRGRDHGGMIFFSPPIQGGSNWTPLGPAPIVAGQLASQPAVSGRILSIAIDPLVSTRVYVGSANGGVWKSVDGGSTWSPKTDDKPSLAIGSLAIDPSANNRVFAGTGEYHHGDPFGMYYGQGLLYSSDFGETWSQAAAATFDRAEIARILFDPNDSANHMFLACEAGVYESTTAGTSWVSLRAGSACDLVLRVIPGAPPTLQLVAAYYGEGIFTSSLIGGVWSAWTQISSPAFPLSFGRIALGQSRNHPLNIWAAFSSDMGTTLAGIAKSTDGGGTWTAIAVPPTGIWQTVYNLYIAVHPDSPNTVFLGTSNLFRTDTGDAPWTQVTGGGTVIHTDHHAFAFDPSNAMTIFAGSDGGVFRSADGGTNWEHRNRGLSTLQFYDISNHPQWAAVVLGGTQDNGGAFGTGAPAWKIRQWPLPLPINGIEGDIVASVIEPLVPSRMYYVLYGDIWRSDDGGQLWNFMYHVAGSAEWNLPFIVDSAVVGVCYTGGNTLQRSLDAATSWTQVTAPLTGNITAIAVHPINSDIVYVATSQGKVYRVQRTGPDWTLPNVTTTDLTGPPLPSNLYISDVAVDTGGTVWVSFSSILESEETGEFTNDHVYRLPSGGMAWENRSTGLAQANPINSIVVDPTDDNVVFCGGDTSVFRWNAIGNTWELWDQGLPNSPVFRLTIHNPSRLIRAATYGRGIWERAIDDLPEPMVDIYLRDDILDAARGPAPAGVANPFDPANLVWWWQSEDIKVDAPPFQTPLPVTDDVALANEIEHLNAQRGVTNRFYVQVHNRGPLKATNILLRAFFADASLGLPDLPADFWTAPKPFNADPSAVNWTPIGLALSAGDLEAGKTAVVSWDWMVPATAAAHSCLLALATCDQDALSVPGEFIVANVVINQNNATLKNLAIVP